jgi:hypothetical protein
MNLYQVLGTFWYCTCVCLTLLLHGLFLGRVYSKTQVQFTVLDYINIRVALVSLTASLDFIFCLFLIENGILVNKFVALALVWILQISVQIMACLLILGTTLKFLQLCEVSFVMTDHISEKTKVIILNSVLVPANLALILVIMDTGEPLGFEPMLLGKPLIRVEIPISIVIIRYLHGVNLVLQTCYWAGVQCFESHPINLELHSLCRMNRQLKTFILLSATMIAVTIYIQTNSDSLRSEDLSRRFLCLFLTVILPFIIYVRNYDLCWYGLKKLKKVKAAISSSVFNCRRSNRIHSLQI